MILVHMAFRAWQAALPPGPDLRLPREPGPDFDQSIAGEEDPGASTDLPPPKPGDEVAPGAPGTGSAPCPACAGRGTDADGRPCASCQGTGTVTVTVGDA